MTKYLVRVYCQHELVQDTVAFANTKLQAAKKVKDTGLSIFGCCTYYVTNLDKITEQTRIDYVETQVNLN